MGISNQQQQHLKQLPGVDHLMERAQEDPGFEQIPKAILVRAIRETIESLRHDILKQPDHFDKDKLSPAHLLEQVAQSAVHLQTYNIKKVINATGVVVHTNLGRSILAKEALDHVMAAASGYSNLEFDLEQGHRGSRYSAIEEILCELTGAEAGLAVNNNAGAVLLSLDTLAQGKEVIISRGELVEIGGSFRIPDVMAKSGAFLKEVGATNRTHLRDYQQAISNNTGLLLKVHTSNYSIVGFTKAVSLEELVGLGNQLGIPVMEDLGSGNLIDPTRYHIMTEPTVQASIDAGVDVVTFSGDKLLGGPQAGLIVGKKEIIDQIKANPLTRALRIDKLTLAALEATLRLYRDPEQAVAKIPTLRMLFVQKPEIERRAETLAEGLRQLGDTRLTVALYDLPSRAGGGSLPLLALESCCVGVHIEGVSANRIESALRGLPTPIIGRIENDLYIMDPRTIQDDELKMVIQAFREVVIEL